LSMTGSGQKMGRRESKTAALAVGENATRAGMVLRKCTAVGMESGSAGSRGVYKEIAAQSAENVLVCGRRRLKSLLKNTNFYFFTFNNDAVRQTHFEIRCPHFKTERRTMSAVITEVSFTLVTFTCVLHL
jgi:hypothetical protein